MHDAGTRQGRSPRIARQQAIEQGAAPVAGRRMDHQAGRLVDHQQVRVLVDHVQRHGLGLKGLALGRGAQLDLAAVARLDPLCTAQDRLAVDLHRAVGNQLLQVAARELRHLRGQHPVQPLAVALGIHRKGAQLALAFRPRLDDGLV